MAAGSFKAVQGKLPTPQTDCSIRIVTQSWTCAQSDTVDYHCISVSHNHALTYMLLQTYADLRCRDSEPTLSHAHVLKKFLLPHSAAKVSCNLFFTYACAASLLGFSTRWAIRSRTNRRSNKVVSIATCVGHVQHTFCVAGASLPYF